METRFLLERLNNCSQQSNSEDRIYCLFFAADGGKGPTRCSYCMFKCRVVPKLTYAHGTILAVFLIYTLRVCEPLIFHLQVGLVPYPPYVPDNFQFLSESWYKLKSNKDVPAHLPIYPPVAGLSPVRKSSIQLSVLSRAPEHISGLLPHVVAHVGLC